MSKVYSTLFIAVHAGAAGSYRVPEGYRAVVRWVTAFNGSTFAPETAALVKHAEAATIYQRLLEPTPDRNQGFYDSTELRVVLNETDEIVTNNGSDIDMTVSGYLLLLP